MSAYRILLIDDDRELSDLLIEYLQTENFVLTPAYDGKSGLEQALTNQYDIILLDVMLPEMDGFEVLKKLRQQCITPVLMLTAKGDDFDRIFGLELGADDYLPKPFNHRELLARIKAIVRRIEFLTGGNNQDLIQLNNVEIKTATREVSCLGQPIELTGTEFQILHLLMDNHGSIVSKEQISQDVLGRRLTPFDRNIDMHVSNIRKKLQKIDEKDKIKTVRGSGYIFLTGEQ